MPSLEDMKKMADTKAEPLIVKLKSDPNNVDLLTQVGNIYKATHQFKDAATYYDKIVQSDPKTLLCAQSWLPAFITTAMWTGLSANSGSHCVMTLRMPTRCSIWA